MRRIRKLFVTICVLMLFMAGAVPARGEDTHDPYRPVKVESYTSLTFPELYPHCHKSAIIESISDCSIPHEERMSICRLISL